MNKQDYVSYWVSTAERDWEAANDLFVSKKYLHALFFSHLVLEKFCKAHWVKDNPDNNPPRTHNLVYILSQTELKLTDDQTDFLLMFNDFQLEGRYPDYQQKIYAICDYKKTKELLDKVIIIKQWLQNNL